MAYYDPIPDTVFHWNQDAAVARVCRDEKEQKVIVSSAVVGEHDMDGGGPLGRELQENLRRT